MNALIQLSIVDVWESDLAKKYRLESFEKWVALMLWSLYLRVDFWYQLGVVQPSARWSIPLRGKCELECVSVFQ